MIGSGKSEDNLGRNFRTVIASGWGLEKGEGYTEMGMGNFFIL